MVPLRRLLSGVAGCSTPLRPPKSTAPRGCRAGHSIRAPSRREFGRARASSLASSWLANAFHEACTRGTSSTTASQTALWPAHEKRSREWPGSTPTTWRRPGKVPHSFRKATMSSFRRPKTRGKGAATTPLQGATCGGATRRMAHPWNSSWGDSARRRGLRAPEGRRRVRGADTLSGGDPERDHAACRCPHCFLELQA